MVKLSDYVIQFFVDRGVTDAFLISGGGIMHLLDSVGQNAGMRYYCNYHEQACAVSAEGYARATSRPGLCFGTTGPGASNALSGVLGAWTDSVPLFVIAGQVRTDIIADYSKLRQVGPQEGNVVGMAQPVTKYAVSVRDPKRIRYELEYAWHLATTGRPGPVLVELPLDVQGAMIDESALEGYTPPAASDRQALIDGVAAVIAAIRSSRRPLFVPGTGINSSGSRGLLRQLLDLTGIPAVVSFTGKDLIHETHPSYLGVFAGAGQRRANFAIQNCDCLIGLAAGFNLQKCGFNLAGFAPKARRVLVDVDEGQLHHQAIKPDLAVQADVRDFLTEFLRQTEDMDLRPAARWLDACAQWKCRYPVMTQDYYQDTEHVNTYVLMDLLSDTLQPEDQIAVGAGQEAINFYQAFRIKEGQRGHISGWGSLGWDLPMAIGACVGNGRRRTICAVGDGGVQWNLQELLTISHYRLPIKIFVSNNKGYAAIRATQKNFFDGRFVASHPESGVVNPDFRLLASAYGLPYVSIRTNAELKDKIAEVLAIDGPVLCDLNVSAEQAISPRVSSARREDGTFESRPLEDMAPFLPREEVWENMHLFDGDEP